MTVPDTPVSPLVTLATGYGDAQMRSWCHALFALDAQMASIVLQAREPMLAQIRLQWWQDVIGKAAADRPGANPVLAALAPLEAQGLNLQAALAPVVQGWQAALALDDPGSVQDFAQGRAALFGAFASLPAKAARDDPMQGDMMQGDMMQGEMVQGDLMQIGRGRGDLLHIGRAWAIWDMVRFHRRTPELDSAAAMIDPHRLGRLTLPRKLRPLSILARAVQLDIARGAMDRPWAGPGMFARLVWHGVTGR